MALVDLESPPKWWDSASTEFMTADQARTLVGTKGPPPPPGSPTPPTTYVVLQLTRFILALKNESVLKEASILRVYTAEGIPWGSIWS